ncbi:MAG: NERD domain-containing protein [Bacteroidales bacterium]|nr:NERD domain-containing protein [Bacteroidales bacterium]
MGVQKVHNIVIYKHNYGYENSYRQELSSLLIKKFKKRLIDKQDEVRFVIKYSLNYFIEQFKKVCASENSLSFYQNILFLHDQATELAYKHCESPLNSKIDFHYISKYRRILKFIIEQTCENNLISGENSSAYLIDRIQDSLDEFMYLGEMIMMCTELFAEQDMIEDLAQISFDENDCFVFSQKHHYKKAFKNIVIEEWGTHLEKEAVDKNAIDDFKIILKSAFDINYDDVGSLIATIHEKFKDNAGIYTGFNWDTLTYNLKELYNVPIEKSEVFFNGLSLNKHNKNTLEKMASKPYLINKYLYRPIIIWNVDNKDFAFLTKYAWSESTIQLTTNAIPWGKAPTEWMQNKIIKKYVHNKEDNHDTWLDDKLEETLKNNDVIFERNIKNINGQSIVSIPGEIDFIVISKKLLTIFVVECKHLLGRYDMQNQKLDYSNFVTSNNNKSYNNQLARKLKWINKNIQEVEKHFNLKLNKYRIKGCFVINTATFYMYNSDYRLYTVKQFDKVLNKNFTDKEFIFKSNNMKYTVRFPYFRIPEYYQIKKPSV